MRLSSSGDPVRTRLNLEALEPRYALSGVQPTAVEQLFLEQLNDARANPAAYGTSIGLNLSGVAASQPLAFDLSLIQASRGHSQDMNVRNYFDHNTPEGQTPGDRLTAVGFPWTGLGESIAGGSLYATTADALKGLIIDTGVADLGHRKHLLAIDSFFRNQNQVGIGVVQNGTGGLTNYYTIDSAATSDTTHSFITGVAINDGNNNGKYDLGEGLANVSITARSAGTNTVAGTTTSFSSGGYSLRVGPGTYTVTASGGGLSSPITQTITVGSTNARVTFRGSNDAYLTKLYQNILGRVPQAGELAGWSQTLSVLGTTTVVNAIERSAEARTRLVKSWYQTHLGRAAQNGEEQWLVAGFLAGATEEQMLATLLGTQEYLQHSGAIVGGTSSNNTFIQALYRQLLNRTASSGEVNYWGGTLPALGRSGVAAFFLGSADYRGIQVGSYYTSLLHRSTAPSTDVSFWTHSGLDLCTIRIFFEGTNEYAVNG